ncbi:MAG TPA: phosphate/phosphite/phosphonate ABC transporter substrate-binding protein [Candidatus Eisenbacteria bacterium]|jgi:phosphonate transport system substrate-binding protein|nr:phosphate/phosphite/phosphonate ABC transporter substrate-binding protein [Candidatus Eisenbacteria bacterium]
MKIRFLVSAAVFALLSVACGSAPAPAEAPVKQDLVMGFVPSQTSSIVQTNADLLGSYLSKKTGYNITPRVLTSYAAVTEGMTSNNVDIGWVGPLDYVIAHQINGAEAVTKSVRGGLPSYKAFIIVNVKSNINSIADLKGKKFAFGDPLSTSSNLWPRYIMKKNGLNPDSDVTGVNISNQTQISVNVCQGTVDAGAIYDDARKNAGAETSCPGIMTKTKVLATTDPPIPGDPQMIRHNLNSAQKKKLKDAMIAMGTDPTIQPALKALYTIDSLVPAQDSDYDPVRDIVRQVKPELLKPTS